MVIARQVKGRFRSVKSRINLLLFGVFFALPLIKINNTPLVLLNLPERKFHIFGATIWPQEMYFLHVALLLAGILLFLITALYGRVWCGYACPQTVFTDVYDWLARKIVGKRFGKRSETLGMKIQVWIAWFFLSVFFSYYFTAYFVGFEVMYKELAAGDFFAHAGSLMPKDWIIFWAFSTATAFGNMIYFREEMCKLVCPYGRFQTALLDQHSYIVSYDLNRGEPRRERGQRAGEGDCTSCNLCFLVCPTGIDIRDGLQIGCLTCGLCIDACTNTMAKVNKDTLISYKTMEQIDNPVSEVPFIRPRTVIYALITVGVIGLFGYLISVRVPILAAVARDRKVYNVKMGPGLFMNGYDLQLGNMSDQPLRVKVELDGPNKDRFIMPNNNEVYSVAPGGKEQQHIRLMLQYQMAEGEKLPAHPLPLHFKIVDQTHPKQFKLFKTTFGFPREK